MKGDKGIAKFFILLDYLKNLVLNNSVLII
jgi:hypothetical protein